MDSLSSLSKDIVVFLQFENACSIRLDMTFNRNTWQHLVSFFSWSILWSFLIFTYNVFIILIFKIMYSLSWGQNIINVFLHFKNQCNMRSYYRHKRKYMAHLKSFFFIFILHVDSIFIHSVQNLYYFKKLHSFSSLLKDIVVFLQFENACSIRLDMTFNRNTWHHLVSFFSWSILWSFLIFTYNVYNILILQIMYNLSWGPNNINAFLHLKNQCNMRSYYHH